MQKRLLFLLPILFCSLVFGADSEPVLKTKLTNSAETNIVAVNADGSLNVPFGSVGTGSVSGSTSLAVTVTGMSAITIDISGTWSGTIQFESSTDGTNWEVNSGLIYSALDGQPIVSAGTNGRYIFSVAGDKQFRSRAIAITGTANISYGSSVAPHIINGILSYVFAKADIRDGTGIGLTSTLVSSKQSLDVNVSQSAIPTGAATSALQTSGNASLTSIDGGTPAALGQTTMSASMPVTLASNQSALPVTGTFFQATQPVSGTVTANAGTNLNTSALALDASISTLNTSVNTLLKPANTLASVTTVGAVTSITNALPAGNNNIGDVDIASSVLPSGASTSANQVTELASLAAIDAGTAAALGQTTMSASVPVALASNQSSIPVTIAGAGTPLTANAPTTATVGVASASALASNAGRDGVIIVNVSVNKVCLGLGSTAVLNSGICLLPGGTWTMDAFSFSTGTINAIASAASSVISIQEFQ